MADEVQVTFALDVENGYLKENIPQSVLKYDQGYPGRGGHVQWIGTSADEVIDIGDVGVGSVMTEGYCYLRNIEEEGGNYVTIGPESSGSMVGMIKLNPGDFAWFRVEPDTVMRAQSNTNDVKLDVRLFAN